MQSFFARCQLVGSGTSLECAEEVASANYLQRGMQLLQIVLILFQRREGQVVCVRLLRNLREEVATLHLKLPVFLVTVRAETGDDLCRVLRIEWCRHQQDATATLLLRLAQHVTEKLL